ncbi:MAG: TIGR04086 family membrane protein [Oscillospiraceae bacterium]|nr:TIGR04086 family membrane protein [Oscillospiraceae bacterium]
MRRKKRNDRFKPYLIGTLIGYAAMIATVLPAALILSLMKSASKAAGAAAVIALMIGGFVCGKTAGFVRQRDGLKTGFLCGLAFSVPIAVLTLIFSRDGAGTLFLKIALCASFAAVGGVSGVNSTENR